MFSIFESFFFVFLAITFILVLLMVNHFKKRIDILEKTNDSLGDICKTIVGEIEMLKTKTTTIPTSCFTFDSKNIPFYENTYKNIIVPEEEFIVPPLESDSDEVEELETLLSYEINEDPSSENVSVNPEYADANILVNKLEEEKTNTVVSEDFHNDDDEDEDNDDDEDTSIIHVNEKVTVVLEGGKPSKRSLSKKSIQELRSFLIGHKICTTVPSTKLKKSELIQMILDATF